MRARAAAAGLVPVAVLLVWWHWNPQSARPEAIRSLPPAPATIPEPPAADDAPPVPKPVAPADAAPGLIGGRPALDDGSLRGTVPDGRLSIVAGRIRVDLELRRRFDYFHALVGELGLPQIRALLAEDLGTLAGPEAVAEALRWFDRYLDCLAAVDVLAADAGIDAEARLATLVALRRQRLGLEVAEAFFAAEEALDRHALLLRRLRSDPGLSAVQRQAAIEEATRALPEPLREQLREAAVHEARLATAQAIASLPDEGARLQARERAFGPGVAARMARIDAEQAAFRQRLSAYRRAVEAWAALPPADAEARRRGYLAERFSEAEIRRIDALEAIGRLDLVLGD